VLVKFVLVSTPFTCNLRFSIIITSYRESIKQYFFLASNCSIIYSANGLETFKPEAAVNVFPRSALGALPGTDGPACV
jgi:hypothetical protein